MTHHVAVGEVDAVVGVLACLQSLNQLVGDLGALHPGSLLEGNHVGGNLHVGLQLVRELAGLVAVPEIGDVTVLLSLGDGVLLHTRIGEELTHGVGDLGRIDQVAVGNVQVAVVLQHTGVQHVGHADAVELVELAVRRVGITLGGIEGLGDLNGAVAAEVVEDHGVAVVDGTHRLTVLGDDEGRQILVDDAQLGAVGLHGLGGRSELTAVAQHVGVPAALHHRPVGLVAVHSHLHTAAARGDGDVEGLVAEIGDEGLEGVDVLQSGGLAHVTAVDEDVDADTGNALLLGLHQHGLQVVDVGVDVTVGEETQEVEGGVVLLHTADEGLPGVGGEHLARLDGLGDQLGTLGEDLTCAEGVVAHLGVAHIVVGGKTDGGTVSLQSDHGVLLHDAVKSGGVGEGNGVAGGVGSNTHAIHDDGQHGALDTCKACEVVELVHSKIPFLVE